MQGLTVYSSYADEPCPQLVKSKIRFLARRTRVLTGSAVPCYLHLASPAVAGEASLISERKEYRMRKRVIAASIAAFLWGGVAAAQQEPASSFWHDSWAPRDAQNRAVDLYVAEAQLRARNDGYGPGQSTVNYNGTVNSTSIYEGTVNSSGATNIGQSNSTNVSSSGSNIVVSVTTGQTSNSMSQNASSGVVTAGQSTGNFGINSGDPQ